MSKGNETKKRILALERILLEAESPMYCNEIIYELRKRYQISVDRKTLYDDIAVMTIFVNVQHKRKVGYWIEKVGENNE